MPLVLMPRTRTKKVPAGTLVVKLVAAPTLMLAMFVRPGAVPASSTYPLGMSCPKSTGGDHDSVAVAPCQRTERLLGPGRRSDELISKAMSFDGGPTPIRFWAWTRAKYLPGGRVPLAEWARPTG
jgi:hypothetical protein